VANRYVWSGASGSADGSSWANAHLTLAAAITASSAGDNFFVAHDHAESSGSAIDLQFKGTAAAPDHIYCVNRAGSVPPVTADLRTTATVTTTGATDFNLGRNSNGYFYCYGISFVCGSGSNGGTFNVGAGVPQTFEACNFKLGNTSAGQTCRLGIGASKLRLINCTLTVSHTSSSFSADGSAIEIDGPASGLLTGSTIPSALFSTGSLDNLHGMIVRNTDFSNMGSSGYIQDLRGQSDTPARLINCKLNTTPVGYLGGTGASNKRMFALGCGTTGSASLNSIYSYVCNLSTETTIVRTGGASDGITPFSWKLVPQNSINSRELAFETFEGSLWNDAVGSAKSLTVHIITDGVTLKDDEIWLEVDYLGSSSAPVASRVSTEALRLTAGANVASDTATWTTTGLTTPTKQKLVANFTPQMAGPIRWRIRYAHASATVYVCPRPDVT
jgi:hypothetical protein